MASRETAPINAIRIVGKRTRKPQKIAAWISPGTSRWSSLLWPSTISASLRARRGRSPERSVGLPIRTRPTSSRARRANRKPLTASASREGERSGQHRYDERALRSSAVIAGTISVRSPITA